MVFTRPQHRPWVESQRTCSEHHMMLKDALPEVLRNHLLDLRGNLHLHQFVLF